MSRALILSFTALAPTVAVVALPVGATPPGTNGKIVFERPTRDGGNLFTVAADSSDLTQLTRREGFEGDASWSGDGTKVAFVHGNPTSGPGHVEIWVVNADGSGLERLTRHRGFSVAPAWSPDGRKIAYATDAGRDRTPLQLFVMNADGSGKQRIRSHRTMDYSDPSWSPNGRRIAFAILRAGDTPRGFDSSIAAVDASNGGNFRRLTRAGGPDELNPNWSPDGSDIAFERTRRFPVRQSDIALMNADGSGKRRITATGVYETNPSFAPDGTRIAFTGDRDNRQLSKDRLGRGFELYTMAADGGDIVRLTDNRRPDLFPDWQPLP